MFAIQLVDKMRKEIGHEINQLENYYREKFETFEQELRFICGIDYEQSAKVLSNNVEATKVKINKGAKIPPN